MNILVTMARCVGASLSVLFSLGCTTALEPADASKSPEEGDGSRGPDAIGTKGSWVAEGPQIQRGQIRAVQTAFSRGLHAVGDAVDVSDFRGWVILRRATTDCWIMTLHRYQGQHTNTIRIVIPDRADVDILSPPVVVAPALRKSSGPAPEEVFLRALYSMRNRVDWGDPAGEIMFTRTREKGWVVRLLGYRSLPFQGLLVFITDDLRVKETSSP